MNKTILPTGKFIPTRRTPGISTSSLLERIVRGYRSRDFDEKLAKMGCAELKAEGSDWDDISIPSGSSSFASRSISPIPGGGIPVEIDNKKFETPIIDGPVIIA